MLTKDRGSTSGAIMLQAWSLAGKTNSACALLTGSSLHRDQSGVVVCEIAFEYTGAKAGRLITASSKGCKSSSKVLGAGATPRMPFSIGPIKTIDDIW